MGGRKGRAAPATMGFPDKCHSPKNLTIEGKAGPGGEEEGGREGGKGAKKTRRKGGQARGSRRLGPAREEREGGQVTRGWGRGASAEKRERGTGCVAKGRGQAVIMELEYAVTASFATPRK